MKKAIEKLLLARTQIVRGCPSEAIDILDYALEELKTPRWVTPERWEAETGEAWSENGAVYVRFADGSSPWFTEDYASAREHQIDGPLSTVCATEAGPPPDDWKPEEGEIGKR
jgi:hypothetical protein